MAARIHETAIVEDGARLGEDVVVGAYSCVGPGVELGDGVEIKSHVVVAGSTRVGQGCRMFPFASIGQQPQDLKYGGEPSRLEIGENNIVFASDYPHWDGMFPNVTKTIKERTDISDDFKDKFLGDNAKALYGWR